MKERTARFEADARKERAQASAKKMTPSKAPPKGTSKTFVFLSVK